MKNMRFWFFYLLICCEGYSFIDYQGTMNDFMGVNIHAQLYFDHYNGTFADYDISLPFRWVRNYHPWGWFESVNDNYQWNFSGEGKWKWFDDYYNRLAQDSINILITLISPPAWVTGAPCVFNDNGDGSDENHYRESAEYLAQLAARYGPSGNIADEKLESSDAFKGLDLCRYFEDSNEPNQWWETNTWNPVNFGKFLNAAHDGSGVSIDESVPLAGVKQGDSNAYHVLGGMAGTALVKSTAFDGSYLDTAVKSSGRSASQIFDVINFHQYWNTTDSIPWPWTGASGVCPENGIYERGDSSVFKMLRWRDLNAPGRPVWLTEFGWDTYSGGGNNHSYQYAPELQQANYIMRSFALLKREGIDKAFVYFDQDPNSSSTTQYASCGLVKNKANSYQRKISYYFMTTMRRVLGEYHFSGAEKHAEGNPQVFVYRYSRTVQDEVLMVWCRDPKSIVDNGTTLSNYEINIPGMNSCMQIVPKNGSLDGESNSLPVINQGDSGASVVVPLVSETPRFLKLALSGVSTVTSKKVTSGSVSCRVKGRSIQFYGIPSGAGVEMYRLDGKLLLKYNSVSGTQSIELSPGTFIYRIEGSPNRCGMVVVD